MTQVLVLRHGETEWNRVGRIQGHLDSDLTPQGVAQAEAARDALGEQAIAGFYGSDLGRALRTAEIVAAPHGGAVRTDPRLRERDFGTFQGRTHAEIRAEDPDAWARYRSGDPDYDVGGGESSRALQGRVVACVEEIASRHRGGSVLVATHGGVVGSLFRHAVGLDLALPRRFGLGNGGLAVLTVGGPWRLEAWNALRPRG